ncbi:hypothetical protein LGZ99_23565 [Photorhabdus temperata]|uniref:hypothetical protein n=1 Tax=Photorhabdus TaxID=29487 RepID=UPI00140E3617|nr:MULTISPECIES: hypothetical protein [Photorhabdus]MCT8350089.1 hypothetical protein [Photorhabdus temperata]
MGKVIKTNKFIGDSMPPGLARKIYEQAKQQPQQSPNKPNEQSPASSSGGSSKNQ